VSPEGAAAVRPAGALAAADVLAAAAMAGLPLAPERAGAVADLLNAWLPAAAGLSARMRDPELDALPPVTAFTQAPLACEEV
jgi:hypothetical protein